MCIGTAAVGLFTSIAKAAVGFAQASQAASQQNAYYESNRRAAVAQMRDSYTAQNNKLLEERTASAAKLFEKIIEQKKKTARVRVASAEASVTGVSVDALERDFISQQARRENAIMINYGIKRNQVEDNLIQIHHRAIGRINSVRQATPPSPLGLVLGIAGAGLSYKAQAYRT